MTHTDYLKVSVDQEPGSTFLGDPGSLTGYNQDVRGTAVISGPDWEKMLFQAHSRGLWQVSQVLAGC